MISLKPYHPRRGFTLLEVLVVIGLIMFLMSIAMVALGNSITLARQKATEATILKIHGLMQQRIDAFQRALDKTNLSQNSPPLISMRNAWQSQYSIVPPDDMLRVMVKKQFFQWRFPQTFADFAGGSLPPSLAAKHTGTTSQSAESAALLYWILTDSDVYGIAPVDESEFSSSEVQDSDGDGLKEFVDGWGRPLRYYRWPTHLLRCGEDLNDNGILDAGEDLNSNGTLDPPGPASPVIRTYASAIWSGLPAAPMSQGELDPLLRDPDDPTMRMYKLATNVTGAPIAIENFFTTPNTYHAFLIVSAGPDGKLGLLEPANEMVGPAYLTSSVTTSFPALGTAQGRLCGLTQHGALDVHPINDNITNRKR